MPIRRDPRTGRWFFRAIVTCADRTTKRVYGTPGVPGPYHDLPNTKVGAQEAERRAIASALDGRSTPDVAAQREEVPTIREYAPIFRDEYAANHKPSEQTKKRQILDGHILPFFGDLRLDGLALGHLKRFAAAERKRGCAVKTVNNRLAVLGSLIKYAVANGVIPDPGLEFQIDGGVKGSKPPALPMADVDRLLDAETDERYRAAILLAAEAGLRAGEIRGLQWGDIADGQLTVRRALDTETDQVVLPKHDKVRAVPISPRLAAALAALPRRRLWVVSRVDGRLLRHVGLYDAIVDLYDRARVARQKGFQPIHGLRHTFGTEAAASGVPLPVLKELMGHSDVKTTMRYIDVSAEHKRDAIATAFGRGSHMAAARKVTRN